MSPKKITLPNGLRFVLIPQPASVATTVLILVKAGSEYETKKINGISHFLEHLMFKGTKNRPQPSVIATELDSLGAKSNAFTSQEYTGYWAKAGTDKLPKILEIVSDLYLNPIFNPAEIDRERGVVIEEINMYEDMPMRRVGELFMNLLYGNQPSGWDIAGSKEVIRRLRREDFLAYRGIHYLAPATVVVISGKFNEREIVKFVRATFGSLPRKAVVAKPKTIERQRQPKTLVKFKESDQSHLVLGVRAFDIFDKRRYALQVLTDVLGGGMSSRLFRRVREELGAAYYVNADADLYLDHGYLAAAAGVDHQKIGKVIGIMLEEFGRLVKEPVQEKELQKSKDHLTGSILLGLETSDELAGYYGTQEILTRTLIPPKVLTARIQGVKADEIREVARAIFKPKKLNLAVIGPYKNSKPLQKLLRL